MTRQEATNAWSVRQPWSQQMKGTLDAQEDCPRV